MLHVTHFTSITKRYDDAVPRQTFRFVKGGKNWKYDSNSKCYGEKTG